MQAEALFDRMAAYVGSNLPPGVSASYYADFLRRHPPTLVSVLDRHLRARAARPVPTRSTGDRYAEHYAQLPDLWTPSQRTVANLRAMEVAASKRPGEMTAADRESLAAYSGWGGLSIQSVAHRFPAGFPVPEARGLIHEYYTPSKVAAEVARVIRPLVPELPKADGAVLTLEPSAGIGRFVQAAGGPGFEDLSWLVVEWSELSSRMLQALRSDLAVTQGPFERWVREHGPEYARRLGLVLANPPYGQRGVSVTEDPDRSYREKNAYAYFLRRSLDLLAPNGLGVFLVPAGFLTGRSTAHSSLRETVLKRHHLGTAFRLPSDLFPGARLVTDLLFFRAHPGNHFPNASSCASRSPSLAISRSSICVSPAGARSARTSITARISGDSVSRSSTCPARPGVTPSASAISRSERWVPSSSHRCHVRARSRTCWKPFCRVAPLRRSLPGAPAARQSCRYRATWPSRSRTRASLSMSATVGTGPVRSGRSRSATMAGDSRSSASTSLMRAGATPARAASSATVRSGSATRSAYQALARCNRSRSRPRAHGHGSTSAPASTPPGAGVRGPQRSQLARSP